MQERLPKHIVSHVKSHYIVELENILFKLGNDAFTHKDIGFLCKTHQAYSAYFNNYLKLNLSLSQECEHRDKLDDTNTWYYIGLFQKLLNAFRLAIVNLYHGTDAEFQSFDLEKCGSTNYSDWGKGIYLTRIFSFADSYRIDAVTAKDEAYNAAYKEYLAAEKKLAECPYSYDSPIRISYESAKNAQIKKFQEISSQLQNTLKGRVVIAAIDPCAKLYKYNSHGGGTDPYLAERALNNGCHAILIDEGFLTEEYVVVDPRMLVILGEIKPTAKKEPNS